MQPELERYAEHDLTLVIATADSPSTMQDIVEEYELEAVVMDDSRGALARMFGIRALPSSFLFDREGVLVHTMTGWDQGRSLAEWVDEVEGIIQ